MGNFFRFSTGSMGLVGVCTLLTFLELTPANANAAPGVFIQDTGPDGLLVVEAEHFSTNNPGVHHGWTNIANTLASAGNAMQALPNVGTSYDSGYAAVSP